MNKKITALVIIALSVIADIFTKSVAVSALKESGVRSVDVIDGVFSFTYHENRGAAFGMFSDSRWFFMAVSTVAILAIAAYIFFCFDKSLMRISALSLIVGGGIGNMIDRIKLGYVVDFLYFELIDFPIFNVADICVTIGAVLLIAQIIFFDKKEGELQGTT